MEAANGRWVTERELMDGAARCEREAAKLEKTAATLRRLAAKYRGDAALRTPRAYA